MSAEPISEPLPELETLAERLLDAAAAGDFARELARAQTAIVGQREALDPLDLFRYWLLCFDVAQVSTSDRSLRHETAANLLLGAAEAGGPAWDAIRTSSRLDDVERLALADGAGIELLELLAYAPDAGMRGFAVSQIEAAGMRALDAGDDSRALERLLHAIAASADAYRLESARKQREPEATFDRPSRPDTPQISSIRVVAVAGGHAQLRATTASLLQRHGLLTISIPSSLEAVRRERAIVQSLQGVDLVLLLVRQITHSTSDQVRKAADRLGVPVVFSNALSAVAIERQLLDLERQ